MIIVQDKLISDDLVSEQFVCNLNACKGACCWQGDAGAPLDATEIPILEAIYDKVKPYLSPAGIAVLESVGKYTANEEGDLATPLIDDGPCAYMTLNGAGIAQCGIEKAWKAGEVDFQKPVSCHLFPVRVTRNAASGFEALNYEELPLCSAACELGKKEQVPVYRFVKDAIVRQYGLDFYEELDGAAEFMKSQSGSQPIEREYDIEY